MDKRKSSAPAYPPTDHRHILEDAREHPERTYREHEEAARRIASESYRAETRRLADLDLLDACYVGLERL